MADDTFGFLMSFIAAEAQARGLDPMAVSREQMEELGRELAPLVEALRDRGEIDATGLHQLTAAGSSQLVGDVTASLTQRGAIAPDGDTYRATEEGADATQLIADEVRRRLGWTNP